MTVSAVPDGCIFRYVYYTFGSYLGVARFNLDGSGKEYIIASVPGSRFGRMLAIDYNRMKLCGSDCKYTGWHLDIGNHFDIVDIYIYLKH